MILLHLCLCILFRFLVQEVLAYALLFLLFCIKYDQCARIKLQRWNYARRLLLSSKSCFHYSRTLKKIKKLSIKVTLSMTIDVFVKKSDSILTL